MGNGKSEKYAKDRFHVCSLNKSSYLARCESLSNHFPTYTRIQSECGKTSKNEYIYRSVTQRCEPWYQMIRFSSIQLVTIALNNKICGDVQKHVFSSKYAYVSFLGSSKSMKIFDFNVFFRTAKFTNMFLLSLRYFFNTQSAHLKIFS